MSTIGAFLDGLADAYGDRPALIAADGQLTYAELVRDADRVAKGLARLGVSKGTRVGLLMPNRPAWLASAFGALKLGAILVPLNTLLRGPELAYALRHADVTTLLMVARFLNHTYSDVLQELCPALDRAQHPLTAVELPALRHVVIEGDPRPPGAVEFSEVLAHGAGLTDEWLAAAQREVVPADLATIFFTSGTTAAPKGAVHTHASMLRAAHNVADRLGLTAADRTWGYLPFFFTGGLVAVAMATLSRGGAVILQEVFDAGATLKLMAEHGCTTLFAWPHQAEALIAHPDFARTPLRIHKGVGANTQWAARLYPQNHQAVGTWGMTETGPMAASSRYDDPLPVRTQAHGWPMPGLEFRIVNDGQTLPPGQEGELIVRGDSVMTQYYKVARDDCFDGEGFFHTGDVARIDADGLLHFIGRVKDVIKTAGVNVAAAEVEATLQQHPDVRVACVTAVAHPTRGENVAAFVIRHADRCSEADLLSFCRDRLASYKVPRHIFLCRDGELPVLGSGKIDKQAVRRLAEQRLAQST